MPRHCNRRVPFAALLASVLLVLVLGQRVRRLVRHRHAARAEDDRGVSVARERAQAGRRPVASRLGPHLASIQFDLVLVKFVLGPVALDVSLLSLFGVLVAYLIARSLF